MDRNMNEIARNACKMNFIGFALCVATTTLFVIKSETFVVGKGMQKPVCFE